MNQHEYGLLNEIAQDSLVTQAGLSKRLGIAVGSVNWYIKRLMQRGWIKVSHLDRTRLRYDLTAQGLTVFTQRALLYATDSLRFYGEVRAKARQIVMNLETRGIRRVYLEGDGPMIDILRLTCIEGGLSFDDEPGDVVLMTSGQSFVISESGRPAETS